MERRDTCSYHHPRSYTQATFLLRAFNHINRPNRSILSVLLLLVYSMHLDFFVCRHIA
uniref:Uncharacterized protein n=1 Tax=Hyaloperonospora arabidopsidis (strain Emoy2) TaxID=559515 RepID=M4BQY3_HYAAE